MCPARATLEPPTVKFVNVPVFAVKVEAETWVAFKEAVPVTFMSPNVAVDALTALNVPVPFTVMELASTLIASIVAEETTKFVVLRFVNTPLVFSTLLDVNPLTFVARLVMSEMLWVCPVKAKPLVAAVMADSSPSMSATLCPCPSRETALPSTVILVAEIALKLSWSKVVAA